MTEGGGSPIIASVMSPAADASAFREFERAGWERIPRAYGQGFGRLTVQAVEPLLDAAAVRAGTRLVDVATGPGYAAAAARARGANVVAIDFSPAMIGAARHSYPGMAFCVADAEELPFADETFDAVVMNFGLLHLGRPERSLREARRVLRDGASLAFTVWARPEEAVGFGIVLRAIERHGAMDVGAPAGPPFFRFSDPEECERVLAAVGFTSVETRLIPQFWRLGFPEDLFAIMRDGTVRTAGLLRAQTAEALAEIRREICAEAERYVKGGVVELPMPALLVSGRR